MSFSLRMIKTAMSVTCKHCGGAHPAWDCKRAATKSSVGNNVAAPPLPRKQVLNAGAKSTAAQMGERKLDGKAEGVTYGAGESRFVPRRLGESPNVGGNVETIGKTVAGTQALPVDTIPGPVRATEVIVPSAEGATPSPGASSAPSRLNTADPPRSGSATRKDAEEAAPKPKKKIGRPRIHADPKLARAQYMVAYRKKQKAKLGK